MAKFNCSPLSIAQQHNSMERSPFPETYSRSASQDIPAPYGIIPSINELWAAQHGNLSWISNNAPFPSVIFVSSYDVFHVVSSLQDFR